MEEYYVLILALAATGALAGLIAGLFGIGGGIVMVPAMYYVFGALGYEGDRVMHVAVGTSLAVIIATSLRSVSAHAKKGAVDFAVLKQWVPFIVIGTLIGTVVADYIPSRGLTGLFGGMALLLSLQFFFGRPSWKLAEEMPGGLPRIVLGNTIGVLSALMGIGGGVMGVTLMTLCGKTIHRAVATAAGFGVAIGIPGALGFIINGWGANEVPFSLGYVNMPGFALLAGSAFFVAPLGAKLAHSLPEKNLKRFFALGLAIVGVMLVREAVLGG
ncbi:sulfite exporter TauE/SafE family protein [Maricaulis sp.]|uniref:sulfite exporter TauE/SafE family protein n=1 Tax=unclassified Maricaulis TaxID=2632371 RepID=UPI001B268436|nr:sulfite exporter TauE/SafE family protein [Maricaulis sp.]MBO6797110.1 sulfite exporter TauE/SafE family protein [Maricaulis sp.]